MTTAKGDAMTPAPADGELLAAGPDLAHPAESASTSPGERAPGGLDSDSLARGSMDSGPLDSGPLDSGPRNPRPRAGPLAPAGWLRWFWRQLTSMRTALILLFLLALASVPGSVLPQEGI